ncbi:DMT family transporter [Shimia sp.]|uniref:DMT family transporter n=1 Tax=Shimia sp. TaxID=1954381 RepID=UPI003B8C6AE5
MKLLFLTTVTMMAFAANSVLNRAAVGTGDMDALSFGVVRLVAGAVALAALVVWQNRGFAFGGAGRGVAVAGLLIYIFGFSLAYRGLDAGLGALILFGVVQMTMFGGAIAAREAVPTARWLGAGLALAGLVWLLTPGDGAAISVTHAGAMALAGFGWGLYSLQGRKEVDATQATAMNFIFAAPVAVVVFVLLSAESTITGAGLALAIVSGVITSGAGYALWYAILPDLGASRAAVAQLTVPVIAMAGGMVFLSEPLTMRFVGAAVLVIGGVLVSMRKS